MTLALRWWRIKERVRRLVYGPRPPPKPFPSDHPLQQLVRALEKGYQVSSGSEFVKGGPLVVEDLSPVMACISFWAPRKHRAWGETRQSWDRHNAYWGGLFNIKKCSSGRVPAIEYHPWWPKALRIRYGDAPKPFVFQRTPKGAQF